MRNTLLQMSDLRQHSCCP